MACACHLRCHGASPRGPWHTLAPPCTRQPWRAPQQWSQPLWRRQGSHRPIGAVSSAPQSVTSLQEAATALDRELVRAHLCAASPKTCTRVRRSKSLKLRKETSSTLITPCEPSDRWCRRRRQMSCHQPSCWLAQDAGTASEAAALRKAEELRDAGLLRGFGRARQVRRAVTKVGNMPRSSKWLCTSHAAARRPARWHLLRKTLPVETLRSSKAAFADDLTESSTQPTAQLHLCTAFTQQRTAGRSNPAAQRRSQSGATRWKSCG